MRISVLLFSLVLVGCGGDPYDDWEVPDFQTGTPPSLSNLVISPNAAYVGDGGGQIDITGSVDFVDPDGDLLSVELTIYDSAGQQIARVGRQINDLGLGTSGTVQAMVTVNTTVAGDFRAEVSMIDVAVNSSNTLSTGFRIADFPYVSGAPMGSPREGFATIAHDGRIYLIGGRYTTFTPPLLTIDVETYWPGDSDWLPDVEIPVPVANPMVAVANGSIYVIGGTPDGFVNTTIVQEFTPQPGFWTTKMPMPGERYASAAAVHDGLIYVAGGSGLGVTYSSMIRYDPMTDSWSTGSPMTDARTGSGAGAIDDQLLVYGGYLATHVRDGGYLGALESYDPVMDVWSARADGQPRRDFGTAVFDGKLFVFGGSNMSGPLDRVDAYDPAADSWDDKTPLPEATGYARATVLGDTIYIVTSDATYEYTPANDIR